MSDGKLSQDEHDVRDLLLDAKRRHAFTSYGTLPDGTREDQDRVRFKRLQKLLGVREREFNRQARTWFASTNGGASSELDGATAVPASTVKRERVEWLDPGRVPLKAVTLIAGDPGLGKSMWTCSLAAEVSRRGDVALMATAEDAEGATVRPRLEAAQAKLDDVRFVRMRREGIEEGIAIPDDVHELDRLVEESSARLVVIDPLMAHLPEPVNSWRDQSVRRALAPLHRLAEKHGCAVVVVLHLNKGRGGPLQRMGGSMGIPAAARSAFLLAADPEDGNEGNKRVLAHVKCNLAPLASSLLYEIKPVLLPASDSEPDVDTARLELLGESELSGPDLLAAGLDQDEERSALAEAEDFLQVELAEGAEEAKRVLSTARSAGIAEVTLRRAAGRLVDKHKDGFQGPWKWRLKGDQPQRSSLETAGDDHLRETPHGERESGPSELPEPSKDGHLADMSTFGAAGPRCNCPEPRLDEPNEDRCTRCWGWPTVGRAG